MSKPILQIGQHDYTDYIEELTPTKNDLDADGSGRDVQTGLMYRTKIAEKLTWQVKMLRLSEALHNQLVTDLNSEYVSVKMLDPKTNTQTTKTYYCSSIPYGSQRYDKKSNKTYYDGCTFSLQER